MRTLVLGLGNPILSDDGVGYDVAREVKDRIHGQEVTVMESSAAGFNLLDLLTGYDKAIIVDAIQTMGGKVGQIYRLTPEAFAANKCATTPHELNLPTALELGRRLGLALPEKIAVFAIEVADTSTFSEERTPKVSRATSSCVKMILQELGEADA